MESICECPVCFNNYSDTHRPLICPCGHTMCQLCLKDIILKTCQCPICSKEIPSDIKSFTVNYSLIPPQPANKPSVNHSILAKKFQEELKFLESINKSLTKLQNDHLEQIKNTEHQLVNCIKTIESFIEKFKLDISNRINQVIEFNEAKIKEQRMEVLMLIEKRQGIIKKIIEAQRSGKDLDVSTYVELELLEDVKQIKVLLRKTEFAHQIEGLVSKLGESLQQNFKIQECPYYFSFKSENELGKIEQVPNDFRINFNNHLEPKAEIQNIAIQKEELYKSAKSRDQQVIIENPPAPRGNPYIPEKNNMDIRKVNASEQRQQLPREQINNLFDPNIRLEWFIDTKNKREKLPDFALGQIERCRVQKKSQIKIFREGRVKFIADLTNMEYLILDQQERIVQTLKLTCNRV